VAEVSSMTRRITEMTLDAIPMIYKEQSVMNLDFQLKYIFYLQNGETKGIDKEGLCGAVQ